MCEAGDGIFLYAQSVESIMSKCARLFRAGRAPRVEEVTIDWGVPTAYMAPDGTSFDRPTTPRSMAPRPWPAQQQSPAVIRTLHAGTRLHVFAILTLRRAYAPREVVLRVTPHGGAPVDVVVPVKEVQLKDEVAPGLPLVHTLAAWRLIQDLQETGGRVTTERDVKEEIVSLGETYQLASRYTSLVAVGTHEGVDQGVYDDASTVSESVASPTGYGPSSPPSDAGQGSTAPGLRSLLGMFFPWIGRNASQVSPTEVDPTSAAPGAYPPSVDNDDAEDAPADDAASESSSTRTFTTLSSLESRSSWSEWSDRTPVQPVMSSEDRALARAPSPQLRSHPGSSSRAAPNRPRTPPPVDNLVLQLISLQAFDGSFAPDGAFRAIVGAGAVDAPEGRGVQPMVWATALAIAWLEEQMEDQAELREDLLGKPMEVLMRRERHWRRVLEKAREVIARRSVIVL